MEGKPIRGTSSQSPSPSPTQNSQNQDIGIPGSFLKFLFYLGVLAVLVMADKFITDLILSSHQKNEQER
jgi:quinol-cytochrome oxidoreductase complex cytochrome b subunit